MPSRPEDMIDTDLPMTNPEVVQGRDYRPGRVPYGGDSNAEDSPQRHTHEPPDHTGRGPLSPGSDRDSHRL